MRGSTRELRVALVQNSKRPAGAGMVATEPQFSLKHTPSTFGTASAATVDTDTYLLAGLILFVAIVAIRLLWLVRNA